MNENKDVPIRDAATVILLRQKKDSTYVLMGQRGNKAAFMPSKYVFPGGAVDQDDANVELFKSIDKKYNSNKKYHSYHNHVFRLRCNFIINFSFGWNKF